AGHAGDESVAGPAGQASHSATAIADRSGSRHGHRQGACRGRRSPGPRGAPPIHGRCQGTVHACAGQVLRLKGAVMHYRILLSIVSLSVLVACSDQRPDADARESSGEAFLVSPTDEAKALRDAKAARERFIGDGKAQYTPQPVEGF